MPKAMKQTAVAVAALAALFWWAFMFAKHAPDLRPVIPFGDDPYDAVGSFAVIVAVIAAVIVLVRAFRPYAQPPTDRQRVCLLRSQMAVVLCVWITLAVDAIAMTRHARQWAGSPARNELLALLGGLAIASVAVFALVCRRRLPPKVRWRAAGITTAIALAVLAVFPDALITRPPIHLLAILLGALVLFAPMRPLLHALAPHDARDSNASPRRARIRWAVALIVGAGVGAFAFIGEMSEGGPHPTISKMIVVAAVFVVLSIAGLSVAYAFLGEPLGL